MTQKKEIHQAEKALNEILDIVHMYLPPDGIDAEEAINRIIEVIDPWPVD